MRNIDTANSYKYRNIVIRVDTSVYYQLIVINNDYLNVSISIQCSSILFENYESKRNETIRRIKSCDRRSALRTRNQDACLLNTEDVNICDKDR